MLRKFILVILITLPVSIFAQSGARSEYPSLDKSPLDVSYYPVAYPTAKGRNPNIGPLAARIIYSRPASNNRPIFGELIPFGKVWRTGANENTELELFLPATIGDKKIKEGKYSVFVLVEKDSWEIILNKDLHNWGAFSYKSENDVVRVKVPVKATTEKVENFAAYFKEENGVVTLNFAWENTQAALPIKF